MELYSVEHITEQVFKEPGNATVLISNPYSNSFAKLAVNSHIYVLSWSSSIDPEILLIKKYDLLLVGIDESVAGVNIKTGNVVFRLGLNNFFHSFKETELGSIIISETNIIIINGNNCSISRFSGVPGIIESIQIKGNKLVIDCLEGTYEI